MALYGNTDSDANKTKVEATRGNGPASASGDMTVVFVDEQEAALAENKARGINGPGWWNFHTYTQGSVTRTKAECLAFITNPDTNANETQADDAIAADFGITIDGQPAAASVLTGDPAQFIVAAVSRPAGGTLSFQWQEDQGSGFVNVVDGGVYSGATLNTLDISDATGFDTYQYRVVISVVGGADVISSVATLTVT